MKKIFIILPGLVLIAGFFIYRSLNTLQQAKILVQNEGQAFTVQIEKNQCVMLASAETNCDKEKVLQWLDSLKEVAFVSHQSPQNGPDLSQSYQVVVQSGKEQFDYSIYPVDKEWLYLTRAHGVEKKAGYIKNSDKNLMLKAEELVFLPTLESLDSLVYVINDKEISVDGQIKKYLSNIKPLKAIFMGLPSTGDLARLNVGLYRNENIQGYFLLKTQNKKIFFGRPHVTEPWVDYWLEGERVIVRGEFQHWLELTTELKKASEK